MEEEGRAERALALIDLGRLDAGRAVVDAMLAADPDDAEALRLLAVCWCRAGHGLGALEAADRAVAADPDSEWGHRLRASALLLLGRPDDAMAGAREAIRLAPDGWAGHLLLAVAAASAGGRWRASRSAFRQAARLAPAEAEVPYVRGVVLHSIGARRRAERMYRDALRIHPQHAGALEGLAAIAMERGLPGAAIRYLRSATFAAPGTVPTIAYTDRIVAGVLGWAVMTTWVLMLVLFFTVFPVAWLIGAGVVAVYLLWARSMVRALTPNAFQVILGRIRSQPGQLSRLVLACASALVALGVGVAASRLDPRPGHYDPLPLLLVIVIAMLAEAVGIIVVDRIAARRARGSPGPATAMDLPRAGQAAANRLVYRCFAATLIPATVLFLPAVDPDPDRGLRAALGTAMLAAAALTTWLVVRHQPPMSDAALARWRFAPNTMFTLFSLGWLTNALFLLGAAYLPDNSPLLVDVLAVGAVVAIPFGLLIVTVASVALALRWAWRRLAGRQAGEA